MISKANKEGINQSNAKRGKYSKKKTFRTVASTNYIPKLGLRLGGGGEGIMFSKVMTFAEVNMGSNLCMGPT